MCADGEVTRGGRGGRVIGLDPILRLCPPVLPFPRPYTEIRDEPGHARAVLRLRCCGRCPRLPAACPSSPSRRVATPLLLAFSHPAKVPTRHRRILSQLHLPVPPPAPTHLILIRHPILSSHTIPTQIQTHARLALRRRRICPARRRAQTAERREIVSDSACSEVAVESRDEGCQRREGPREEGEGGQVRETRGGEAHRAWGDTLRSKSQSRAGKCG